LLLHLCLWLWITRQSFQVQREMSCILCISPWQSSTYRQMCLQIKLFDLILEEQLIHDNSFVSMSHQEWLSLPEFLILLFLLKANPVQAVENVASSWVHSSTIEPCWCIQMHILLLLQTMLQDFTN
jgi:hypothetical protein